MRHAPEKGGAVLHGPAGTRFATILNAALLGVIALVVLLAVATTRADVDLWGHVRFGTDILETHRIAAADPYSFTSDRAWINHEWLSEVVFAEAWRLGGNPGLIAVKVSCAFGALALLSLALQGEGIGTRAQVPLLGLALIGILPRVNHVRPQLFSVLLFAALLLIFERAARRARRLAWAVPVLALWCNLHGGWIVGVATVGLWALGCAWSRRAEGWRTLRIPAWAALAVAATLANPYGIGLWRFLFDTVGLGREAIGEWAPLWTTPPLLLLWGMFAGLGVAAVVRGFRPRNPAALILPAVWGVAALRVSRLDAFFALSVVGLLGPGLPVLSAGPAPRPQLPSRPRLAFATSVSVLALLLLIPAARRPLTCVSLYAPWWPEPASVDYMRRHGLSGNVVSFFRWGEYGIWHLPRALKISMDGRRETVYTDAVVSGHVQLYSGTDAGLAYLDSLPADYVWLPRELRVVAALEGRGWVGIFEGPQSVLLAKANVQERRPLPVERVETMPVDRCFPGP